jgi:DNA-damage-inducible protein J
MNMSKTGYITARVEPKLKESAGRVLKKVGVSTSQAITLFLRQVVMQRGTECRDAKGNRRTGSRRWCYLSREHQGDL